MKTVLLVIESEEFGRQICRELEKEFRVLLCRSAAEAAMAADHRPDALVLQMDLPGTDGLAFLERMLRRPPAILTLAVYYSPYVSQRLYELGTGYYLRTPCTLRAVTDRVRDMLRDRDFHCPDPQAEASAHLTRLGISTLEGGGKHLRVGIPLYAQDPGQKLKHQLYPAIADICGSTADGVEHMIRRAIGDAWTHREPEFWQEYFPQRRCCPTNKVFLCTLAGKLRTG